MSTHTRTHVHIDFADPYLTCDQCKQWVTGWHDNTACGCDDTFWNLPCHHTAGATSVCPSWGPVDDCECDDMPSGKQHAEPNGEAT